MAKFRDAGTFSCALFAVGAFKENSIESNDEYLLSRFQGDKYKECVKSVSDFYSEGLFPVDQPLYETGNFPFDMLMDAIEEESEDDEEYYDEEDWRRCLKDKFCIASLSPYQQNVEKYWAERLVARGFELVDVTMNSTMSGDKNYIYIRNPVRPSNVKLTFTQE